MGASCSIKAHCRNSLGEIVESKLFSDLEKNFNRKDTKIYYGVASSSKFLELNEVQNKAKFDENGELTIDSFMNLFQEVINISDDKNKLLQFLNSNIESGIYTYEDCIGRLQEFNRNSQFNDNYLATITSVGNNNYRLEVVKKTAAATNALTQEIKKRRLIDRVKYYLAEANVDTEFVDENNKISGRYSTENAEETAIGLYNLVRVAQNEKMEQSECIAAGHFAVAALGNNQLVQRLIDVLTPEVQEELIAQYGDEYIGGPNRRNLAGRLVGDAIYYGADKKGKFENLIGRIINSIKKTFYKINKDQVKIDILEAEKIAEQIAKGFMSPSFEGSIEHALETAETYENLYSKSSTFNVATFKKIAKILNDQVKQIKNINRENSPLFEKIAGEVIIGRSNALNTNDIVFANTISLEGITEAVYSMSDLLVAEIPDMLDDVDFSNYNSFKEMFMANSKKLRTVRIFIKNALQIIAEIEKAAPEINGADKFFGDVHNVQIPGLFGHTATYDLIQLTNKLKSMISTHLINELENKEKQLYLKLLEDANYGSRYVKTVSQLVFKWKGKKRGDKHFNIQKGENIDIQSLIEHMDSDIGLYDRFLSSMSNSSDIVAQLSDRIIKESNKNADDYANIVQDRLKVLKGRFEDLGFNDTSILYERSNITGQLTGNIISEYCWGDYEADAEAFRKNCIEEFNEMYKNMPGKSDFEKSVLWDSFYTPKFKDWRKEHAVFSKSYNMYVPNDTYKNMQYAKFLNSLGESKSKEFIKWMNAYLELKRELDEKLPEGAIPFYRVPQLKGRTINKMRNRVVYDGQGRFKSYIHTTLNNIRDAFCEDANDIDFGCDQNYNTLDADPLKNQIAIENEKANRIPIFGVNKLQNMSELSTDLFFSTFAYAGMVSSYYYLNGVVDALEIGRQVLERRTVGNEYDRKGVKHGEGTNAYKRYVKFLDKQLYLIGTPKIKIGRHIVLNKILGSLTSLASKLYLGGNVFGGLINTFTGRIEILKEAWSGEFFDRKDLIDADKLYMKMLKDNPFYWCEEDSNDYLSLFIRHFNVLNDNKTRQRDWHSQRAKIFTIFGNSLFLPYKTGDHYMQSISYLAVAKKIKIYNLNGKQTSLLNAYALKNNTDDRGNYKKNYGKTFGLKEIYVKNKEDIDLYNLLKSIVDKIEAHKETNSPLQNPIFLTDEETQYLKDNSLNLAELNNTLLALKHRMQEITWTTSDESDYINKCTEINNRMHGIYNSLDSVEAQQDIYLKMVLAMKGYALGMIKRRFGKNVYNTTFGYNTEGSLHTAAKTALAGFALDSQDIGLTCRALLLPFSKKTQQELSQLGYSKNQIANLKRNCMDFTIIGMLFLLKVVSKFGLKAGKDDDDDDEKEDYLNDKALGLTYYFASRLLREQAAFNLVKGLSSELPTLMKLLPVGVSALFDVVETLKLFAGSKFVSEENFKYYYQQSKPGRYEKYDPKWQYKFFRLFPYLKSVYVWRDPVESAKSYEYGKDRNK